MLNVDLSMNDRIFIVGPNGSGKSALIQHFAKMFYNRPICRISAHRQTWLASASIDLTAKSRRQIEQNLSDQNFSPEARWKDNQAGQRLSAVLFDLMALENERARKVMALIDDKSVDEAVETAAATASPFSRISEILAAGNLTVRVKAAADEEILAFHQGGELFSIALLSDGERNAVILAATVITADSGTIFLIDEPERHLHRSIIEPLLTTLFNHRMDCMFIISTHDLALPVAAQEAQVLLPRSCNWNGENPQSWEIDLLPAGDTLPDDLRAAILGSRRKILFVEGNRASLDLAIYGALFPGVSVISKGGCSEVIRAVEGLRSQSDLHWVSAYGLVDRDNRSDEELVELQERNIHGLKQFSVESIFYSKEARSPLAGRQAEIMGTNAVEMLNKAEDSALSVLEDQQIMRRLCARRCERKLRDLFIQKIPTWKDILQEKPEFEITTESPLQGELEEYRKMLKKKDLDGLIARYPVRETSALNELARKLEFSSKAKYEQAVLALVSSDQDAAKNVRTLVGSLKDEL